MDIEKRVDDIFSQLIDIRRDFHMHPELSEQEYRTCDRICEYLNEWGIEHVKGVAETGVVAIIRGKKDGKTVGARADIDALPITELTDIPFKSVNEGVMHACGHDIHTAIHLGVAKILKEIEDEICGNVKIFFQPAEETIGGAKKMIEEGYLKNPDVEYMLSLHVMPYLDAGEVEFKYGKVNAATNEFSIKITGKSSHAAYPDQSVDPIVTAGYIITALQSLVSRNISPLNSVVLTLGQINGGIKNNIIPGEVIMSGTLRTIDPDTRVFAKNRIREITENTAKAYGAAAIVEFEEGYPALINNDEVVDVLRQTAESILSKDKVKFKEFPSMGADDFSFFLQDTKGAYYNLGCGNKDKGWTASIHSECFMADEKCIRIGVLLQTKALLELLDMF
ncbi:M20 family metallopeptidase [uncultured Tissierella sp.]|jgi:amidohydrolase|uniref:M20 metallopeptidase family protein n=1 Tax=uncultured Tissierella sp. TaxID=448160 RepID=UPI002805DBFB|nr:M20 family metallopeptidase [uncultured Tissierella sp.]MDU5081107.1 M20 family metallopeptidase [Bacillota bacterium]